MTIYIDSDYKCYTRSSSRRRAVETDVFDGFCAEYIEGCRFIPAGDTWTRWDGVRFGGEMVAPFGNLEEMQRAQAVYEKEQYDAAVDELLLLIGG